MNERLSRMERHSRKQQKRRAVRDEESEGLYQPEHPAPERSRLRRSSANLGGSVPNHAQPVREVTAAVSNSELNKAGHTKSDYETEDEVSVEDMPSRRDMYPSHRIKWTKWFYNSLVFIFIAVLILLFFWGMQKSTWGAQHNLN